jgi:H+-transporting ATPase
MEYNDNDPTEGLLERAEEEIESLNKVESEEEMLKKYPISHGLTTAQAEALLAKYGKNELPEKVTPKWLIFLQLLWQPMPIMIWVAAIVEIIIENYLDMGILIIINLANASLSFYETNKAGNAVAALKASLKPTAVCFRDGKWIPNFDARLLVPGDLVELASGAAAPADVMVNEGQIDVDESAMTGESFPITVFARQMAKMGGTVVRGETHGTVVLTGKDTFFGKTATMLSTEERFSNLQKLLMRIMIILCILAFTLSITAFMYIFAIDNVGLRDSASFAVVLIVASIPMAIEIVTTTTLAIGSKVLTSHGAIVSRLASIEDLAGMTMLCSDKTGTLTKNKMTIQPETPIYEAGLNQMDLLKQAAMGSKWKAPPKDALDTLFLRCPLWLPGLKDALAQFDSRHPNATTAERDEFQNDQINTQLQEAMKDFDLLAFVPFDPRVKRTESTVLIKSTGKIVKVTKGAPHVIQALDLDHEKGDKMHHKVLELGEDGIRAVAVAVSDPINDQWREGIKPEDQKIDAKWNITGLLTFLDPPRDDTKETIRRSQEYGVPVRMITGDNILIAKKTCKDLVMGELNGPHWPNIKGPEHLPLLNEDGKAPSDLVKKYGEHIKSADGFAQVFPEHKFLIVECFREMGYKCGMTGDGVNDAPALKRADVGIAVAGATDAAKAAASIVLTKEGLSTIIIGIEVARGIFARMKSFLTYRIAATLQLLTFFFIAVFAFKPRSYTFPGTDPADVPIFFSLPVIFLMIITVINDGTLISIGYDHAVPSKFPEKWNLLVLFIVSIAIGAVACGSSLLLLFWCLDSSNPDGLFQQWGIGSLDYGHITCIIFLKVAVSDILSLFSSRTAHQFFFQRRPHMVLVICTSIALMTSTTLALIWPCTTLDDVPVCGLAYNSNLIALWVWLYCIVVFFIQDAFKVLVWRIMIHFNLFNVKNINDRNADLANDKNSNLKLSPESVAVL